MKDIVLLLMRLVFGGLMLLNHGIPKLSKLDNDILIFPDPLGISPVYSLYLTLFSEVIMSGLLVLGVLTRWVSIPLMITMFVAVFIVHKGDALANREMAILYFSAYSLIAVYGPGKLSVDYLFKKK